MSGHLRCSGKWSEEGVTPLQEFFYINTPARNTQRANDAIIGATSPTTKEDNKLCSGAALLGGMKCRGSHVRKSPGSLNRDVLGERRGVLHQGVYRISQILLSK
uniref:Uncharacterized protein n=1 Tax=Steinernema glaseri TaxID=37863 RepID=A0A1I8AIU1_9BILA